MRKTYGNTWWGKQWLNALEVIDNTNRLPRGRSYANIGAARRIKIKGNLITAQVDGSRPRPYQVTIAVQPFGKAAQKKVIEIIAGNPHFLSQLLNRNLPEELYEACREQGIQIFPRQWDDLTGECSCPDWAVPCKHLAAVLYLIANEIDKDPFLAFELHGLDVIAALKKAGFIGEGQKEIGILNFNDRLQPFSMEKKAFNFDIEQFEALDFSRIPYCRDDLMSLLSEKPVFFPQRDFKKVLATAYKNASGLFKKVVEPKPSAEVEQIIDQTESLEIFLDSALDFLQVTFRDRKGEELASRQDIYQLLEILDQIPVSRLLQLSASMRGLYLGYRFAQKLLKQGAFVPELLKIGKQHYRLRWIPALINEQVNKVASQLGTLIPKDMLYYKLGKEVLEPVEEEAFTSTISLFLNDFMIIGNKMPDRILESAVGQLFFYGALETFNNFEDSAYPSAIQLWLNKFFLSEKAYVPLLKVDEVEVGFEVSVGIENKKENLKEPISLEAIFADESYEPIRMEVLRDLSMLAEYFPQIQQLIASRGTAELFFDSEQFVDVLFRILPIIRLFGIKVLLPKSLRKLLRPKMSLALTASESGKVGSKSMIGMDKIMEFDWQVAVGGQLVNASTFIDMAKKYSGIVKLNDEYVYFSEGEIKKLINQLEAPPALDQHQLLQAALTEEYEGAGISLDTTTRELIDQLLSSEATELPEGLQATLRPYQLRGYEWLYKNARLGFGSLIADDMGLGKTLQVITTLLKLKEEGELGPQKALIIVPTTLLTNWDKEIRKFAPDLKAHIYHGSRRTLEPLEEADLLITTYGVVRSDTAKLSKLKWLVVAIDEAQNIKNPTTAQTKAVKKIPAAVKIAMSGTPVENRLSEYWSIFDFSNKGYLKTLTHFKDEFARPIELDRDQAKLQRFRDVTAPFILRRLKTDKTIIKDLPDKVEKDEFCELSTDQAAIYQNVIDTTMAQIEKAEGIARKGLVLKLITALKQICNHPTQYLKKGAAEPAFSGKCMLLVDLVRQILDNGEKMLIFTQYQTMGQLLVEMLDAEFGFEASFLHGGVSRKKRDEMVEDFQNNRTTRVLLLSLKAGGTGLNLTAASHVIHFDLWWNPAVEAQATDRAYRIGQNQNVIVHRFITKGTFEEKINKLLQSKKELANLAVSTGEQWIGDYSDDELRDLVSLG